MEEGRSVARWNHYQVKRATNSHLAYEEGQWLNREATWGATLASENVWPTSTQSSCIQGQAKEARPLSGPQSIPSHTQTQSGRQEDHGAGEGGQGRGNLCDGIWVFTWKNQIHPRAWAPGLQQWAWGGLTGRGHGEYKSRQPERRRLRTWACTNHRGMTKARSLHLGACLSLFNVEWS